MYDSGKIILGIIFVALFTFPTWYNFAGGEAASQTRISLPENEDQKECVECRIYACIPYGFIK